MVVLGCALFLMCAYLLRESFTAHAVATLCFATGGVVLAGTGVVGLFLILVRHHRLLPVVRVAVAAFASVAASLAFLHVGLFFTEREITPAKRYPELIAPALEEYRAQHGHYPANLADVPGLPLPPSHFRGKGYTLSRDGDYAFFLADPATFGGWHFRSSDRRWRYSD